LEKFSENPRGDFLTHTVYHCQIFRTYQQQYHLTRAGPWFHHCCPTSLFHTDRPS